MKDLKLRLHDTLSGELKALRPRHTGRVGVYTCGPTVYDDAHVGHARAALAPDILVRHLRGQDLDVRYVRNITDVDDKILKRSGESGEQPTELSARMAERYHEDLDALGCLNPTVEPKVSEHIGQIIALVQRLIANGAAYEAELPGGIRDVYYGVRSFAPYGKLSKRRIEDMRVGARIEASEHKQDPLDFALWKGCTADGWGWESPWGKGRPGWHIECSAMATEYLGHGFDVHCGGMDLIFPHHENEIAQSEAAFPDEGDFVSIWIHNGFVNVDKEKMAKSLGNFVTIRDVYQRYDPEALRYFLLGVHYRGPIGFETEKLPDGRVSFPGIAEAERRVDYLYSTWERLLELAVPTSEDVTIPAKMPKELLSIIGLLSKAPARVQEALDDDLNTPVVLAVIADLAKAGNELCDLANKRRKDKRFWAVAQQLAQRAADKLKTATELLGLLQTNPESYSRRTQNQRLQLRSLSADKVEQLLQDRRQARVDKDFARADAIRDELTELDVELSDSPTGTTWRINPT